MKELIEQVMQQIKLEEVYESLKCTLSEVGMDEDEINMRIKEYIST